MSKSSNKTHWKNYWTSKIHQPRVIHEELLKNLQETIDIKGKKILEVGGGMGGDSLYLVQKGAKVTILDFIKEALDTIKASAEKQKLELEVVLTDAQKMPFKDKTFDIVFHQGFLEHFCDPLPLLKEQRRVLKDKGILVVDVPQKYTTYTIKKHMAIRQSKWFAGWEKEYSIGELESLVRKAGFGVIKSYGWGYYGKLYKIRHLNLGKWYNRLWEKIEASRIKLYLVFSIGVVAEKI